MQPTIQGSVEQIINSLKSTCFCPESEWVELRSQLTEIFVRYNKPEVPAEELAAAKQELESAVETFRGKHQRVFVYEDPFGY